MNKVITTNKKAYHDYFVVDTFETGIRLVGCEVKSLRNNGANLKDSYVAVKDGQLVLVNAYIKNYDFGSFSNVNSMRDRVLLAHRSEINRLVGKIREKGFTMVPLKMYFVGSLVKVEVGLVRGKQLFDKKRAIAQKDALRDMDRQMADAKKRL